MAATTWTYVVVLWLFLLYLLSPSLAARYNADTGCRFPTRWTGTWFQSGIRQPITIQDARLSTKGRCLFSDGDKFLLVDDKNICYRCVVIHEKHINVLQYKETYCMPRDSLQTLCSLITGDALLYSMFREAATSVPCPFRGGHTFTYNRGHGECRYPVSSIDSCTQDSRLLLRYQACPDVHGTESTVEELECLATWKEGSSRYLVGKVVPLHHTHSTSNEDSYRCFVYEKMSGQGQSAMQLYGEDPEFPRPKADDVEYRVAQSGDATCNGLFSPMEGSRTMTLKKVTASQKCKFPMWLTQHHQWYTLDYRSSYKFHHRNTTLHISNTSLGSLPSEGPVVQQQLSAYDKEQEVRVVCSEILQANSEVAYIITHYTVGCQNGYMCMMFHKRDAHIIEVQSGGFTRRPEDACNSGYFDRNTIPFITLVTENPETKKCPHFGRFSVNGVSRRERHTRSHSRDTAVNISRHQGYSAVKWLTTTEGQTDIQDLYNRRLRLKRNLKQTKVEKPFQSKNRNYDIIGRHLKRTHKRPRRDLEPYSQTKACSLDFKTLMVGCASSDTMEFRSECSSPDNNMVSAYSCHGGWSDNSTATHYLITTPLSRSSRGAKRYCFVYQSQADNVVMFSTSADTCRRDIVPGSTGVLAFNITSEGQCQELNTASSLHHSPYFCMLLLSVVFCLVRPER
ncbi:uncharacterized protein LOC129004892 [Macrosteles quadrilineatus]|uniref:uncharacterized protein LOC129004892 n=1 Tax=Macrosteles quadrilineatus TaxID=74068 RepID=UPI0023E28DA4|nr:uncharacterized protein LOC129004892 [Macrosteles quadrilineatus]